MNSIDYSILIIIGIGFVFGVFKGLIKELASLAAIFLAIYGANLLSPIAKNILVNSFKINEKTASALAYVIIFFAVVVGLLIISRLLDKMLSSISLGGINKLLGGVFGAIKYALIISVLINIIDPINDLFQLIDPETRKSSITMDPLKEMAPKIWEEAKTIKTTDPDEYAQP